MKGSFVKNWDFVKTTSNYETTYEFCALSVLKKKLKNQYFAKRDMLKGK